MKRGLVVLMLVLLATLTLAAPASAADTRSGDTIVIGAGETVNQDLYAFASKVQIDGTIKGDLIAFAQEIVVNGTIEGDLQGGAQTILVKGVVKDDARIVAQTITLGEKSQIGDDLLAMAYSLELQPGSTVGGDTLYAGYQGLFAGMLGKRLQAGAVALDLRGTINGDVQLALGESDDTPPTMFMPQNTAPMPRVAPGLTIAESAKLGGKLTYQSRQDAKVAAGAQVVGGATRTTPPVRQDTRREREQPSPLDSVFDSLRHLVALLIMGLMVLRLVPAWTHTLGDTILSKPLPSLGWGAVAFIGVILAGFALATVTILLAILFGIVSLGNLAGLSVVLGLFSLGALLIGFALFTGYIAQVAVAYLGGRVILERVAPAQATGYTVPFIVGAILLVLVMTIPLLGGLIGFGVMLLGLGALWLWFKARRAPQTA